MVSSANFFCVLLLLLDASAAHQDFVTNASHHAPNTSSRNVHTPKYSDSKVLGHKYSDLKVLGHKYSNVKVLGLEEDPSDKAAAVNTSVGPTKELLRPAGSPTPHAPTTLRDKPKVPAAVDTVMPAAHAPTKLRDDKSKVPRLPLQALYYVNITVMPAALKVPAVDTIMPAAHDTRTRNRLWKHRVVLVCQIANSLASITSRNSPLVDSELSCPHFHSQLLTSAHICLLTCICSIVEIAITGAQAVTILLWKLIVTILLFLPSAIIACALFTLCIFSIRRMIYVVIGVTLLIVGLRSPAMSYARELDAWSTALFSITFLLTGFVGDFLIRGINLQRTGACTEVATYVNDMLYLA